MLVGQTQTFPDGTAAYSEFRIGATSLSSPLFAGIMALADQRAGQPHGFANPALYGLAGTSAFRDVVDPTSTVAAVRNDFVNSGCCRRGPDTGIQYSRNVPILSATPLDFRIHLKGGRCPEIVARRGADARSGRRGRPGSGSRHTHRDATGR